MADGNGNRLAGEKSPYLLQHADNPVDWHPWGEEAFEYARKEDKPVFLSIGYSTCHWCHVMERESFVDDEVAMILNEDFVCIKVDREERPDIDGVYMEVCQLLTGSGGWPLSIFMTADKVPFFAGTYFPKEGRFGRPGLLQLLPAISEMWSSRRDEVDEAGKGILDSLKASRTTAGDHLDLDLVERAYGSLLNRYDHRDGGFGTAPKFPSAHNLIFLIRHWKLTGEGKALDMAVRTLTAMRRGGIWDHVGFGFHRYSIDARWLVPHFEKMLYDQAMLAMAYLECYEAEGIREMAETAREIFEYVLRDMTSPEGGFYSAEDADSDGEEGLFYTWTFDELVDALGSDSVSTAVDIWNAVDGGNYLDESSRTLSGRNILHERMGLDVLADEMGVEIGTLMEQRNSARDKLFKIRSYRTRPMRDEKVLTDWNGLMIGALARGGRVLCDDRLIEASVKGAEFVLNGLKVDGRLLHRYIDGEAVIEGTLDDHAFLAFGLLELYCAAFDERYLEEAVWLAKRMIDEFQDEMEGGFYSTSTKAEKLIVRRKEAYDGAIPSGNSIAMDVLLRIARLTGRYDLEETASNIGASFSLQVMSAPAGHTSMLSAVEMALGGGKEIVVVGNRGDDETEAMLDALNSNYIPGSVILFKEEGSQKLDGISPFTSSMKMLDGKATAYVCMNGRCDAPENEIDRMLSVLGVEP